MDNENEVTKGTRRERVYNFIVEFMKKNGYAPSVREICTGTDLSSTSSVYMHLLMLEDEGKIISVGRTNILSAKSIIVINSGMLIFCNSIPPCIASRNPDHLTSSMKQSGIELICLIVNFFRM